MYCHYLWKHQCITTKGWTKPCCYADTTEEWKKVDFNDGLTEKRFEKARLELESGIFPECCRGCKENEDQGLESPRLRAIKKDSSVITTPKLTSIDIKFNNTCNLGCIMCTPNDSSTIEKLYKKSDNLPVFLEKESFFPDKPIDYKEKEKEEYVKKIAQNNLRELKVTGGEPFASINFINTIEWLVDNGISKDIILQFNTNGTKYNKRIVENLHNFKKLKIVISVDGTGKNYNYIRKGSRWTEIERNLNLFSQFKKDNLSFFQNSESDIAISCVLQFCNMCNIKSLVEYCRKLELSFYADINLRPSNSELDVKFAPKHLKDILLHDCNRLLNTLDKPNYIAEIKKVKNYIEKNYNLSSTKKQNDLKKTISRLDQIHGSNYKNYLEKPLIDWLNRE